MFDLNAYVPATVIDLYAQSFKFVMVSRTFQDDQLRCFLSLARLNFENNIFLLFIHIKRRLCATNTFLINIFNIYTSNMH